MGFHASERLNAEKHEDQLDASEKNQVTSFMKEKELGFIKILYGRYKAISNLSLNILLSLFSMPSLSHAPTCPCRMQSILIFYFFVIFGTDLSYVILIYTVNLFERWFEVLSISSKMISYWANVYLVL